MLESQLSQRQTEFEYRSANAAANSFTRKDHGKLYHCFDIKNQDSTSVSDTMTCRCSMKPCVFYLDSLPAAKTPSLTQLRRIVVLMQQKPSQKIDPKEMLLMTSMHLPFPMQEPSTEYFNAISGCSTSYICVEEMGIGFSFRRHVEKLWMKNLPPATNGTDKAANDLKNQLKVRRNVGKHDRTSRYARKSHN
ncbi:Enhanced RNAI (RNA interference) [Caenorhabditis elegans]|nr:Enhanced RNAI (RNA interference) [Caenorhabditis elegans]CCD73359.1 Enhanced RNAI (RNA interference) [Caenorhabditis elegans]|eukprot:NP_001249627.1 Enhanced RNAI (RNA interference) [Caenorhabditis elegans]